MGGGIIKTIILGIILVVLAFVLGSLAADGTKAPMLILGALCCLFVFNYMGHRCWYLLFILPFIVSQLNIAVLAKFPFSYGVAGGILIYWVIMWAMGYVRMTWHGVLWMDILSLLPIILMMISYYRFPVSLDILGLDTDVVGGEAFVWAAGAAIYYITVSCIPFTYDDLAKVSKVSFIVTFSLMLIMFPWMFLKGNDVSMMGEQMEGSRFGAFCGPALIILQLLFFSYPLTRIMFSPWRLGLMLLCFIGVALAGFRLYLMLSVLPLVFMVIVRKQFISFTLAVLAGYGVILYASHEQVLERLPYGIQRSLASLPGVEVGRAAGGSAAHSSGWRLRLWSLALDSRSGYIKDYIWGDGFGISKKSMAHDFAHGWRADYMRQTDAHAAFAERGVWHLSALIWLHRLGIVGVIVLTVWMIGPLIMLFRMAPVVLSRPGSLFLLMTVGSFFSEFVFTFVGAGTPRLIFISYGSAAIVKVIYSIMLKEGSLPPLFARRVYVPLLIREHETEMQLRNRERPKFLPRKGEM